MRCCGARLRPGPVAAGPHHRLVRRRGLVVEVEPHGPAWRYRWQPTTVPGCCRSSPACSASIGWPCGPHGCTTVGERAVQVWTVQPNFGDPPGADTLRDDLRAALDGPHRPGGAGSRAREQAVRPSDASMSRTPRVDVHDGASDEATVIEVRAHDGPRCCIGGIGDRRDRWRRCARRKSPRWAPRRSTSSTSWMPVGEPLPRDRSRPRSVRALLEELVRTTSPTSLAVAARGRFPVMDLGLAGRKAIVTGGGRGIGRWITQTLLDEGCDVAICGRTPESITSTGRGVLFARHDHRRRRRRHRRRSVPGVDRQRRRSASADSICWC